MWIMIGFALLAFVALMTRKGVTNEQGITLGLALAIGVGLLVGYIAEGYVPTSLIIEWGWSGGLLLKTSTFVAVVALLCMYGAMGWSARRSGNFYS